MTDEQPKARTYTEAEHKKSLQSEIDRLSRIPLQLNIEIGMVGGGSAVNPVLAPKAVITIIGGDPVIVRRFAAKIAEESLNLIEPRTTPHD